ncbi:MAG: HAD hydrolase-like protein [Elusimicrobiaceae bacterium]|nr:HAD hydrolase-like protein [Elusimicrobiaceae bacterium]
MTVNAILFDLDVFIDTKRCYYEVLNTALTKKGFAPLSYSGYLTQFNCLPTDLILRIHIPNQTQETYVEIEKLMQYFYRYIDPQLCVVNPCFLKTLRALKRKGYHLAVYTPLDEVIASEILNKSNLLSLFDNSFFNQKVQADYSLSSLYLNIFKKMGVSADQVLICTAPQRNKSVIESLKTHLFLTNGNNFSVESIMQVIEHADKHRNYLFPHSKRKFRFKEYIS